MNATKTLAEMTIAEIEAMLVELTTDVEGTRDDEAINAAWDEIDRKTTEFNAEVEADEYMRDYND